MTQATQATQEIVLHTGEFHFASGRVRISTLLGSCVAFTAWHPTRCIGGMCHYLLPSSSLSSPRGNEAAGMYAEDAADLFENAFRASGTRAGEYVVKMFGGGNMFPQHSSRQHGSQGVSHRNVVEGRRLFESRGFVVVASDVGGIGSRRVILDLWSGDVWVRRNGLGR